MCFRFLAKSEMQESVVFGCVDNSPGSDRTDRRLHNSSRWVLRERFLQTYLVEGIEFYFERDSRKTKGGKGISCLPDTLEARFTKGIYSSAVLGVRKCFRLYIRFYWRASEKRSTLLPRSKPKDYVQIF